jgi:hypothetical protein
MRAQQNRAWIVTGSGDVFLADITGLFGSIAKVTWYESDGEKRSFRVASELYKTKTLAVKNSK